jgi:hypothetical protein
MILVFPGRPIFHQRNNVRECNETRYLVFFSSFFVVSWGRGREDTRNPPEKELNSGGFRAERVGEPGERRTREPNIQMHGGHAGGPRENLRVGKFCQE